MTLTGYGVLRGLLPMVIFLAIPVHAQVNIDVHIGEPPPVVVYSPPTMVLLPEPQMYVAVGVPYDIFFIGDRYYYFREGNWFWAPGYGGPWTYVVYRTLPPGLRKFKVERLREYREREYRVYVVQGPRFGGKHFAAVRGPYRKFDDDENEGNGKGKGHKKH